MTSTSKLLHDFTTKNADLTPRTAPPSKPNFRVPFDSDKLATYLLETERGYRVTLLTPEPIEVPGYAGGRVVSALVSFVEDAEIEVQYVRFYDARSGRELPIAVDDVNRQGWQLGDLMMGVPTTIKYLTVFQNPGGELLPVIHADRTGLDRYVEQYKDGIVFSDSFAARIVPTAAKDGE